MEKAKYCDLILMEHFKKKARGGGGGQLLTVLYNVTVPISFCDISKRAMSTAMMRAVLPYLLFLAFNPKSW
jgi:hypothetical protein